MPFLGSLLFVLANAPCEECAVRRAGKCNPFGAHLYSGGWDGRSKSGIATTASGNRRTTQHALPANRVGTRWASTFGLDDVRQAESSEERGAEQQ